jgi:hypothetical protein
MWLVGGTNGVNNASGTKYETLRPAGALPSSARAEEAEDLATFHRKGDVANGGPVSARIGKAEGLGLNHRTVDPAVRT